MRHSILGASWRELSADPGISARLSRELGVPPLTGRILAAKGLTTPEAAHGYLHADLADLHDPLLMRDMAEAVACVRRALASRLPIRICGDYDADGVSATALLVRALEALGATVDYHLPHRVEDGYGLNLGAVERAARDGIKLIITVDCGISDFKELERARELGMEVVVTDHHEPPAALPPAAAVLNPKRVDCPYPFKDLSGVGVAYKLLAALAADLDLRAGAERSFLDLVAIGTIADVVGLTGENRILAKHGLEALNQTRKHGLLALLRAASVSQPVTSYDVAFGLAPRLNAAGRLDDARAAAVLLMTSDPGEARKLADHVCDLNTQRQEEELRTLRAAQQMIEAGIDLEREMLIVLASEEWHPGVIGIVASRLVERYCRPVVLVAMADGEARGSARSVSGYHMCDALTRCSALLEAFGGHELAAGFSIAPANLDALRSELTAHAAGMLRPEDLVPLLTLDTWAELATVTLDAVESINAMAPFGTGNPRPLVGVRDLTIEAAETCGADGKHLRLTLRSGNTSAKAMWFGSGDLAAHLPSGSTVDVCAAPEIDEWNGRRSVCLRLRDLAMDDPPPSGPPRGRR